ncbi:MAG TPA: NAD(P)H-binding protein [Vicinamibacterales bacterium]
MRVLVTGASGALGGPLLAALTLAGHEAVAMSRRERPAGDGVIWLQGDLTTGAGLGPALDGADVVIHAASDPQRAQDVDVNGTQRLLQAAGSAGVQHFVYVSIVGVDAIPYPYYRAKHAAEALVRASRVRYSIVRATQFHSFIDAILSALSRVPLVMPVPAGFKVQSIATEEVADYLVRRVAAGPSGWTDDLAGPEVLSVDDATRAWMAARGIRRPLARVPVPGAAARAFRAGKNLAPYAANNGLTWAEWLRRPA